MIGQEPQTDRGRRTRARILGAAAELIGERGVQGTSLEDIIAAAGVSKSQLYHYFASKDDLARAVVVRQTERILAAQMPAIEQLDSWEAIERWFDRLVALQERRHWVGGCPLGSLANELADHDEAARRELVTAFERWQGYLVRGLAAMEARGEVATGGNPDVLALSTLACIQGGLLLTRTQRSSRPLRVALDAALVYLRTFAAPALC